MTDVVQPSTTQIIAAFAGSLITLVPGPIGLAGAALIPAAEQLLEMLKANPDANYTIDDLAAIVEKGNADLAKLTTDVNALPS